MSKNLERPDLTPPTTTRREFLSGSSILLAGVAAAGAISQTACTDAADAAANPNVAQAPAAADAISRPTTTDLQQSCWLVASDLVTAGLTDGASVTQWADRTTNSYNLQYQPVIPDISGVWHHSPPVLVVNAVNNLPAVKFSAPQQQTLIWTPGGSLDQLLTGFSAVFTCQLDSSAIEDASFLFLTHDAAQSSRIAIILNAAQGGVRAIISTNGIEYNVPELGGSEKGVPFGALNAPVWAVLSLRVWYGLDPIVTLQVNGASSSLSLPGAITPTTPSYMDALCSDSEIAYVTGSIAEMSFYPGYLADAQLAQIESDLQQKYGFSA
jgi:hypothetical protein